MIMCLHYWPGLPEATNEEMDEHETWAEENKAEDFEVFNYIYEMTTWRNTKN